MFGVPGAFAVTFLLFQLYLSLPFVAHFLCFFLFDVISNRGSRCRGPVSF